MKKIFLLQTISLLLISSNIYAQEKISLTLSNKKPSNTQSQIPIDVSIEETTIMILFKENSTYQVIVKGEVGKLLTATTAETIRIELLPYKEGNYSILFYDMEGNEIEGNFLLQ